MSWSGIISGLVALNGMGFVRGFAEGLAEMRGAKKPLVVVLVESAGRRH